MEKRKNRPGRLSGYDYGSAGYYFVTFCTRNRSCDLSDIVSGEEDCVGRGALAPPTVRLKKAGEILDRYIQNISAAYPHVTVEKYVIMPNHVHLLLRIMEEGAMGEDGGARAPRPTIMLIVGGIKSLTTRRLGHPLWQTSFHDHIIRDDADYQRIWAYIDTNPARWTEDIYFEETQAWSWTGN